jgi:hypothetical protein
MSLGSIAHLQYYFARTGVLDGKGAQLAREGVKKRVSSAAFTGPRLSIADDNGYRQDAQFVGDMVHSPVDEEDESLGWDDDPFMLPPTVSTYSHRTSYVPPPPDMETLQRELKESLSHVTKGLEDILNQQDERDGVPPPSPTPGDELELENEGSGQKTPNGSWHHIQGMHILDIVTLAIKAAKDYYTMHEYPERLSKVKSEKTLRQELLDVLEVLRRMATRDFAGGIRHGEVNVIVSWVESVHRFLAMEKRVEEQEAKDKLSWKWLAGDWTGSERLREWEFLKSFVQSEEFPDWIDPADAAELPTPFLSALGNGLTLVMLHNRILKKTKRQTEEIKTYHTDTAKPYRAADNLRYWIMAAERRWETKLQVDVMGIVYNKDQEVWRQFDAAIMKWSKAVREEITHEWQHGAVQVSVPVLKF